MAVSGADSARLMRVLTTTLDRYSPKISNELKRNEGIIAGFGLTGGIKTVTGGQRAVETVDYAVNTNIAFRSYTAEIPTSLQDTRLEAKYGWATISGAIVLNKIEEAMNAGNDTKIFDIAEAETNNAVSTYIRSVADALRASSPGSTAPESILTIVPDTAVASQTTSTGELSRSTYSSFWRSQYTATSIDIDTAAGLALLFGFYFDSCSKGASVIDQPNFGLTTGTVLAGLMAGFGDSNRRLQSDEKMLQLGFQNVKVLNATIIADPSMTAADFRFLNTNYLKIQQLRTPSMKNVGEKPDSLSVSLESFKDSYSSLNKAALLYSTFALTCSSLQRQGIATTIA